MKKKWILLIGALMVALAQNSAAQESVEKPDPAQLALRLAHMEKLCAKHGALNKTSYVGGLLFRIEKYVRREQFEEVERRLDEVERRMKKYRIWEAPQNANTEEPPPSE